MASRSRTSCAVISAGLMMFLALAPVISPSASAAGATTVMWYDHLYLYDTSGGEFYVDWQYWRGSAYGGYDITSNRAYVVTAAELPGGARAYSSVYKEIRFKEGCYGYYTFTVDGFYSGRVANTGLTPGTTDLYWHFRLLDLNNVHPNNIVKEVLVRHIERHVYGSQTVGEPFTATLTTYIPASNAGIRIGVAATITSQSESYDLMTGEVSGNAFCDGATNWGMWIYEIEIQAPCPSLGCVLEGTQILLPDGTTTAVEDIKKNDEIAGYDLTANAFVTESVVLNKRAYVGEVLRINDGLLTVTPTNQPIYARNETYTGWIQDPVNLELGWQLYSPCTDSWVDITNLELLEGRFLVYDLGATSPDNYIGNGILLDRKPIKV